MGFTAAAAAVEGRPAPRNVYFATSTPAYADKTNATAIHAALGLPGDAFVTDLCGTGRSAMRGMAIGRGERRIGGGRRCAGRQAGFF